MAYRGVLSSCFVASLRRRDAVDGVCALYEVFDKLLAVTIYLGIYPRIAT